MIHHALSFIAVVKFGNFSRAAKNLKVSKAQLSRHVVQLEATLGIQLLRRTTRTLTLTEAGEQFFLSCQSIQEIYAEAVEHLKQDFSAIKGTLRITAPIAFGSEIFPALIYQFTCLYPNIKVVFALSGAVENLMDKNFDLAIRVASSLPDSNLRVRNIIEFDRILCASPAYLHGKKIPKKLDDLKHHACITTVNRGTATHGVQWQFYLQKKIINYVPSSIIEIDSLRAQVELIAMGAGIGRTPRFFVAKELQQGKLIEVLANIKQPKSSIYLLYPNEKFVPKKTKAFIHFLKEKIGPVLLQ